MSNVQSISEKRLAVLSTDTDSNKVKKECS